METNDSRRIQKLLISILTLVSTLFATIVSFFIIFYIIFYHFRKNKFKKPQNVSLLLTCNTCLAIICASGTLSYMSLSSIIGDLGINSLNWMIFWACYMRGYLHFVFINAIYLSYVLQAGFRLFRIAFHEYKCLRTIYSFTYYIFVQWIVSFLLILPVLIARQGYSSLIVYLSDEFYCQVPMTSIRGIVFSILSVYFVPVCCIGLIYLWILIYIRRRSQRLVVIIMSVRQQTQRDTIILRRICLVMIVLLSLGIPSTIFVILFAITHHLHWASYRIGWMTIGISFALISLSSLYVTPQIHRPIGNLFRFSKKKSRTRHNSSSKNPYSTRHKAPESIVLKSTTMSNSPSIR